MRTRFTGIFLASVALFVFAVSPARALGVLVPAYFDPGTSSAWTALNQAAQRVPLIAIMNPNNGPSTAPNAAYTQALSALHNAGGQMLGYVYSSYTARPIADVAADVDRYNSFYNIDGIFIDEMTNDSDPTHLAYYQQLYRYIKSKRASYLVVGNPGANTAEIYLTTPVTDALVTFESNVGYPQYVPDSWTQTKPLIAFSHLCYAVSAAATMTNYVQLAAASNVGYIYVTDDVSTNPWDTLPTYWSSEVGLIESVNRQAASNQPPLITLSAPTNGAVLLHVTGAPGRYVLQTSTNLTVWNPLATNISVSGTFTVSDPSSIEWSLHFYRTAQ